MTASSEFSEASGPSAKDNTVDVRSLLAPAMAQYASNPTYDFASEEEAYKDYMRSTGVSDPQKFTFKQHFIDVYSGATPLLNWEVEWAYKDPLECPLDKDGNFKSEGIRTRILDEAQAYGYFNLNRSLNLTPTH